ncbi:hypothetical protein EYF80_040251 [Liparis tanakae]|uniref:Uncharacterized protein n=1 Tax=Liparis tanakae TaxID=230148 RepID=A0A4Z2G9B6_9TELE|nr:hypothetical protein EYF80_040251 [Liparis tanakae]
MQVLGWTIVLLCQWILRKADSPPRQCGEEGLWTVAHISRPDQPPSLHLVFLWNRQLGPRRPKR